jgi:Flp pilus assembly protein TadG
MNHRRQGASAVEMAFVLPVFVLMLFGFFELGHALMIDSIAENAAYEGARRGIVPGATHAAAIQAAEDIAKASSLKSVDVIVETVNLAPLVQEISVTVNAPLSQNAIFMGPLLGNMTIRRNVTMTQESSLRFRFLPGDQPVPEPTPRPRGRGKR